MMKKQEYVPREVKERPLYELQSVEDIPASKLYRVKINGTEQKAYHTEFFDFVSFLGENGESDIEITGGDGTKGNPYIIAWITDSF